MSKKQLDLELNQHLEEVLSSREVSLNDTKKIALALWEAICTVQEEKSIKRFIVQHYQDGKVIIYKDDSPKLEGKSTMTSFSQGNLIDHWDDPELLPILSIIAGNSDAKGKCRLFDKQICRELNLDFK